MFANHGIGPFKLFKALKGPGSVSFAVLKFNHFCTESVARKPIFHTETTLLLKQMIRNVQETQSNGEPY